MGRVGQMSNCFVPGLGCLDKAYVCLGWSVLGELRFLLGKLVSQRGGGYVDEDNFNVLGRDRVGCFS